MTTQYETFLFAVYGSLRMGLGNHGVLDDSEYLGTTTVNGFRLYSLGPFPQVSPDKDSPYPVTVEVYRASLDTARRLDRLEGYPSFYDRMLIDTEFGKAYIYFIEEHGSAEVTSGDWVKYLEARHRATS